MAEHPKSHPRARERIPEIELPGYVSYDSPRARSRRAARKQADRSRQPLPIWAWIVVIALVGAGGYLGGLEQGGVMVRSGVDDSGAPGSARPEDASVTAGAPFTEEDPGESPETIDGAGTPVQMNYVQGDGQEAEAGTALPGRFGVQVTDARNRPIAGVDVRFEVLTGGGIAIPGLARTDSLGRASAIWQLGPGSGFQRLAATSPNMESIVTFTALAQGPTGAADASGSPIPVAPPPRTGERVTDLTDAPPPTTLAAPTLPVSVMPRTFVVGGSTVCRLSDSTVTCRGANDRGQRVTDAAPGSRAITAGLFHVCSLDSSGAASCWGANEGGQLGDGTRTDRQGPTDVATDLRFSTLSAGVAHTCGLAAGGQIACWGQNVGGQLGDGSRDDRTTPGLLDTPPFEALAAGWDHTCALTASGSVYCWGLNRNGQVGDGSRLDRLSPRQITTGAYALAAGSSHTCATARRGVLCWGDNSFGQLGDGTFESRVRPTAVVDLPGMPTALVAGAAHTCALLGDGTVHCWGQNMYGQLGNGSTSNTATPIPVAGGIVFERISAGGAVTCGVTDRDVEYCWGLNQSGQLGDGTLTNRAAPTRVRR